MYNWNQFRNFPKFKNMSAQEQARQYFLYQSNMMMEQSANAALAPAAAAAAAAGAGGGGRLAQPENKTAQEFFFMVNDNVTNTWKVILNNYNSETISDLIDTGINSNDYIYNAWSIVDGKGFLFAFYDNNTNAPSFIFLDINGNIVEKVTDIPSGYNWDYYTLDGLASAVYYVNPEDTNTTIVKWWMGTEVFTKVMPCTSNDIGFNWTSGADAMSDGTFTAYYWDGEQDNVYLLNSKGDAININNALSPIDNVYSTYMYNFSDYMYVHFYNGDIYNLIRLIYADGSYKDIDISSYTADNINRRIYGVEGRFFVEMTPDNTSLDRTILAYNPKTKTTVTYSYPYDANYGDYLYSTRYANIDKYIDYTPSFGDGSENIVLFRANYTGYDGKFDLFNYFEVIWLLKDETSFSTWQPASIGGSGIGFGIYSPSGLKYPSFLYHNDGDAGLSLLVLNNEGANTVYLSGYQYNTLSDSYVYPLGNRIYIRASIESYTSYVFTIFDNTDMIGGYLSLPSSYVNQVFNTYNLLVITSNDPEIRYIRSQDNSYTIIQRESTAALIADYSNYSDYIDLKQTGTIQVRTLGQTDDTDYLIRESSETVPAEITIPSNLEEYIVSKDTITYLYKDLDNFSNYVVQIVDQEGTILQSVVTEVDTYYRFEYVGNRLFLAQTGNGNWYFHLITPNAAEVKIINDSVFSLEDYGANDYRYWYD